MKGWEGLWVKSRKNNVYFTMNKVVSILIAFAFAAVTLSFKQTTLAFSRQLETIGDDASAAMHIRTIYWFLFIYYSLAGMDEMIQLFSVLMQLEKGALGLFFELNYLIGAFLTGYITWFVNVYSDPPTYVEAFRKDGVTPTSS